MIVPIYERSLLAATNTDLLSVGRLNSIPYTGKITIRLSASLADATNFWTFTIQTPDGSVPVDAQLVPGVNPTIAGVIDERTCWMATYLATQGGHFVISLTESGTALCTAEVVLRP